MIKISISPDRFDSGSELKALDQLGGGAVSSFTGRARADGDIVAIELEHYPAMTQKSLEAIAEIAMERWNLLGCILMHRVGRIEVGEEIVLVAAASSHRAEALEACAYLIDRLKTDAPFWKKEHHSDGSALWVDAKSSDNERAKRWD